MEIKEKFKFWFKVVTVTMLGLFVLWLLRFLILNILSIIFNL